MNPYLENPLVWQDFHESAIPTIGAQLNRQLGPGYVAKVESHLFIHEMSSDERKFFGKTDVGVADMSKRQDRAGTVTTAAPFYGSFSPAVSMEKLAFLEIRDRKGERLVTVVELLSPTNKNRGPDRDTYLAKRREILGSQTHLVEIDMLRGGPRMPLDGIPACDYCVVVSRHEQRPIAEIWPTALREVLRPIPIPLSAPDPDAMLDLKAVIDEVYNAAKYERYVYDDDLQPRLGEQDVSCAREFVPGDAKSAIH